MNRIKVWFEKTWVCSGCGRSFGNYIAYLTHPCDY